MTDDLDLTVSEPLHPWGATAPTFTYLAGAAGSGKTFLTKRWAEGEKGLLLCGTTGVAAINLGGTTINAILGYFDTASLQEKFVTGQLTAQLGRLYRSGVRRLIIDEVSMMDGDQLTYLVQAIEEVNGRGYVLDATSTDRASEMGLTLVGDWCQLPPVKAPFGFQSPEWHRFKPFTHILTEIRRQADPHFIEALRAARRGDGRKALEYFGDVIGIQETTDDQFGGATILAKNDSVDRFNHIRFQQLDSPVVIYPSTRWGKQRSEWGNPEKPPYTWGIPQHLPVRVGALVMILTNVWAPGPPPRRAIYVNGDIGTITETPDPSEKFIKVRLQRTNQEVAVDYLHRDVTIPIDSARRKELREQGLQDRIGDEGRFEIVGGIDYLPVRLAWATTCHKAQGLSLTTVQVNIRDAFFKTPAMLYVALSRARTAEGLRLVGSAAAFVERCASDPRLREWF